MDNSAKTELKEIFNRQRIDHIAEQLKRVEPNIDSQLFITQCLDGLDELSLMQRLRHVAVALHAVLPADFNQATTILCQLAPRLNSGFVSMSLGEYVALYGTEHFSESMQTLKLLTCYGSSEFAIRPFIKNHPTEALALLELWSLDDNAHVRRLASEGSRPRLPWAGQIPVLIENPDLSLNILNNLKADDSLYVRKSVANHLNDKTKTHPEWVINLLKSWSQADKHSVWIIKHALRSLIKKGNPAALELIGVQAKAAVKINSVAISPTQLKLGDTLQLNIELESTAQQAQTLVVDYAIHYVKKSGETSAKVFKLKTFELQPNAVVQLTRKQSIRNFSTRVHYAGTHQIDVLVNGICLGQVSFQLHI